MAEINFITIFRCYPHPPTLRFHCTIQFNHNLSLIFWKALLEAISWPHLLTNRSFALQDNFRYNLHKGYIAVVEKRSNQASILSLGCYFGFH